MLIFADTNTTIGVILMMLAITFLVIVLIAISLMQAGGEHEVNVEREHARHRG